jgi:hypothetical protein
MRCEADRAKLERLMEAIGERVSGSGVVYLTRGVRRRCSLGGDIQPQLIRFPAIDAATFERAVREFCESADG